MKLPNFEQIRINAFHTVQAALLSIGSKGCILCEYVSVCMLYSTCLVLFEQSYNITSNKKHLYVLYKANSCIDRLVHHVQVTKDIIAKENNLLRHLSTGSAHAYIGSIEEFTMLDYCFPFV